LVAHEEEADQEAFLEAMHSSSSPFASNSLILFKIWEEE
jgi:hypothetical protein